MKLVQLALFDKGYLWVNPNNVKTIRTDVNSCLEYHYILLDNDIEYKLSGIPVNTIEALRQETNG